MTPTKEPPTDGSAWVTGGDAAYRVLRGGSWNNNPRNCRSANPNRNNPGNRNNNGFRVVASRRALFCTGTARWESGGRVKDESRPAPVMLATASENNPGLGSLVSEAERLPNPTEFLSYNKNQLPKLSNLLPTLKKTCHRYHKPALTEADIFARIVHPEDGNLPQDVSRLILNLRFESEDVTQMNELAEKNNRGVLSETEHQEMEKYLRVGNFLNLLHAKARLSLHNSSN